MREVFGDKAKRRIKPKRSAIRIQIAINCKRGWKKRKGKREEKREREKREKMRGNN